MKACHSHRVPSAWGEFLVAATPTGVCWVGLPGRSDRKALQMFCMANGLMPYPGSSELVERAAAQLREYLTGDRRVFDLPLDFLGTDFQRLVWAELLTIPYGQTRSYGQVAAGIGRPKGARAVGMALGRNPLAVVVPCHRVIGGGGALTGYGGGLELKERLLRLEGGLPAGG